MTSLWDKLEWINPEATETEEPQEIHAVTRSQVSTCYQVLFFKRKHKLIITLLFYSLS